MKSIFPLHDDNHLTAKMFLDDAGGVNISRYDKVKYPVIDGFTETQLGFFWRPQEVELIRDSSEYNHKLSKQEQRIFTSNIKRQTMLDSIQGRGPALAFGSIASLPEVETWIYWWNAFEQLHNKSYTHILQNIYNDPTKELDSITDIEEIVDCAKSISKYYDELIHLNEVASLHKTYDLNYDKFEHKKALWRCLMAVNALEGIRFYVSFACSWAFAETKRMEGNAKIIKFICRDENIHLGATQQIIKILPKDDPDFEIIKNQTKEECRQIYLDVALQEMKWAEYLFTDGSMLGLNAELLKQYVQWITNKRLVTVGFDSEYKVGSTNPLPWTQKWIAGGEVQVAPQQTQISSYIVGNIKKDVTADMFKGLSL